MVATRARVVRRSEYYYYNMHRYRYNVAYIMAKYKYTPVSRYAHIRIIIRYTMRRTGKWRGKVDTKIRRVTDLQ